MILRPHDLLRVTDPGGLADGAPGWVEAALVRTPWVVVRRSESSEGCIGVGVRGDDRAHRHALTIPQALIDDVVRPEDLASVGPVDRRDLPAWRDLDGARGHLDETALPWGPTGSVGFELATGAQTVSQDSDLDLKVAAPVLTSDVLQRLSQLHGLLADLATRVDCQIETNAGAIALAELLSPAARVLVKTSAGPVLVATAELLR